MTKDSPIILRVAVAAPLPTLFDYLPAAGRNAGTLAPGMRVLVPFGRSRRAGILVELATQSDQSMDRLKPIESVLDNRPQRPQQF